MCIVKTICHGVSVGFDFFLRLGQLSLLLLLQANLFVSFCLLYSQASFLGIETVFEGVLHFLLLLLHLCVLLNYLSFEVAQFSVLLLQIAELID
jgi:hypothetical protein